MKKTWNNHALNYNALNQSDTYHVVTLKHVTRLFFYKYMYTLHNQK